MEVYLAAKENPDPLSEDYSRPVSAATLENRRGGIHQLASALVHSGFPADDVVNLGVLVRSDNAKAALSWLRVRRGGESPQLGNQARLLLIINRHWVKSAEDEAELKRFSSNLAVKNQGMTVKNRERLRQFDVDKNLTALLSLPPRVMKEVKVEAESGRSDAVRAMYAIAIEILLMSPIRVKNLVALELGRHLRLVGAGRHRHYVLSLPAAETKNDTEFTAPLPPETTRLIDRYIEHFRDATATGQSQLLFPGHGSGPRSTDAFSHGLCKFIRRETGLVMNVHLFRALAGKIYLGLNPHDIETVRQLLGHRNSATTLRAYTYLGAEQAFKRWDEALLLLRHGPSRNTRPKRATSK